MSECVSKIKSSQVNEKPVWGAYIWKLVWKTCVKENVCKKTCMETCAKNLYDKLVWKTCIKNICEKLVQKTWQIYLKYNEKINWNSGSHEQFNFLRQPSNRYKAASPETADSKSTQTRLQQRHSSAICLDWTKIFS